MCPVYLSLLAFCLAGLVILFSSYLLGKSLAMADNGKDVPGSGAPQGMGSLRALATSE